MTSVFVQPPLFLRSLFAGSIWRIPTKEPIIYLTFDDGPVPEATSYVLEILKSFHIKATFFCIGKNVVKHPELYQQIVAEGHHVGNHTFNHLNGWQTRTSNYILNIEQCQKVVHSTLFRPPYGKITLSQIKQVKRTMNIVMWDVLSYDFKASVNPLQCADNVIRNCRPGSVVVFHDSIKAFNNMSVALPLVLEQLLAKGFRFEVIPQNLPPQSLFRP